MVSTSKLCGDPGLDKANRETMPTVFLSFYIISHFTLKYRPRLN